MADVQAKQTYSVEDSSGSGHSRGGNRVCPAETVKLEATTATTSGKEEKAEDARVADAALSVCDRGQCNTKNSGNKCIKEKNDSNMNSRIKSEDEWSITIFNTNINPLCHIMMLALGFLLLFFGILLIVLAFRREDHLVSSSEESHPIVNLWRRQKKSHCLQAGAVVLAVAVLLLIFGTTICYKRRQFHRARLDVERGLSVYNTDINSLCPAHRQEFLLQQTSTENVGANDYGAVYKKKEPTVPDKKDDKQILLSSNQPKDRTENLRCSKCWENWYRPPEMNDTGVISFPS